MKIDQLSDFELKSKSKINLQHKVLCPCCDGTKIFRNRHCEYCDSSGKIKINDLHNVGIAYITLN